MPGIDAYATSKQCILASAMALAREDKRLRYNAVEPGHYPRHGPWRRKQQCVRTLFIRAPDGHHPAVFQVQQHAQKSAKMINKILTDTSGKTGIYFDEKGKPMQGSAPDLQLFDFQLKIFFVGHPFFKSIWSNLVENENQAQLHN